MPRVFDVTTEDGKEHSIVADNVVVVEYLPGEPDTPAVEAQDAVEDDPGEPPSAENPAGRLPKKGSPAVMAQDAKPGTPDKATIKLIGGDTLEVVGTRRALRELLG